MEETWDSGGEEDVTVEVGQEAEGGGGVACGVVTLGPGFLCYFSFYV